MTGCAFLFPGQASQTVGMGQDLYAEFPASRELFDRADAMLGFPLTRVCFSGPEEELRQTAVTQPAVFVHSVAAWCLLAAAGVEPECAAGHSLGEYSALVAAGALEFEAGLELVERRGQLMQQAGEESPGTMAAVLGLDDGVVEDLCRQASGSGVVVAANFNAPGQVVVSGETGAVEQFGERAREAGAKRVVELAVSGAFHSPLMESAAREMTTLLQEARLRPPRVPVITNVAAIPVDDPDTLRQHLVEQITQPVRWTESIRQLSRLGIQTALEVGPGSVLKGLGRRIAPDLKMFSAGSGEDISAAIAAIEEEQ